MKAQIVVQKRNALDQTERATHRVDSGNREEGFFDSQTPGDGEAQRDVQRKAHKSDLLSVISGYV